MTLIKRLSRIRAMRLLAVVLLLAVVWNAYLLARAPGIISPEVSAEAAEGEPLQVGVQLDFPPERFHTLQLQSYGRVSRVEDQTVVLRDVRPESIALLARLYWVSGVVPAGGGA